MKLVELLFYLILRNNKCYNLCPAPVALLHDKVEVLSIFNIVVCILCVRLISIYFVSKLKFLITNFFGKLIITDGGGAAKQLR